MQTMTSSVSSPARSRRRHVRPLSIPVMVDAHCAANARGPLMTTGQVVAQIPYARVVEVDYSSSVGGRAWVVQATFMSAPESDADWTTIATCKARDGRIGRRERKVYPLLVKTPRQARSDAERYMANASQCLAVESPLFVEARALLVKYQGAPPFAAVAGFVRHAEEREAALRREIDETLSSRIGLGTFPIAPYFYAPPIAAIARMVLFTPETINTPIAADGHIVGRFGTVDLAAAAE